jgi:predicted transcriptional regulator of viral defense system
MNQYITNIAPDVVDAPHLADWALARGVGSFTTEEAAHLLGVPSNQVSQRLAAPRRRSEIFSPARGLWVPVPAEYRTWGAPNPMAYINDMMAYLGISYCVGWLTSAARHGAGHHAAQVFQVAVERQVRNRVFGRSRLQFLCRSYVGSISTVRRDGARVASVGATMLMVASDVNVCGGLNNVANVVVELAEENPGFERDLLDNAQLFSAAALRRIGWLLDAFGNGAPSGLEEACSARGGDPSFLSPTGERAGQVDTRWNIVINEEVDPDI